MSDNEIKPWMREAAREIGGKTERREYYEKQIIEIIAQHAPSVPERAAMPEKLTKTITARQLLGVLERIVGDDFLKDLGMHVLGDGATPTDYERTAYARLCDAYDVVHSLDKSHSCYHVHKDWRKKAFRLVKQFEAEASHDSVVSPEKPERCIEACPSCKSTSLDRERWCMAYQWTPHRVGVHLSGCVLCNHSWHDSVGEAPAEQAPRHKTEELCDNRSEGPTGSTATAAVASTGMTANDNSTNLGRKLAGEAGQGRLERLPRAKRRNE